MKLSNNALTVLERRYLARDEDGTPVETPEELFRRVAHHIAQADKIYDSNADVEQLEQKFYDAMTTFEFLPNSPTLMNAGRPLGQLSACFVLPVADSMEDIFDAVKNAALIHKSGGGTGFSFSRLRPSGATVRTTGGVASGPISFMKVFNAATEAVKQGGTRRGANMGILRVDHPDIEQFISCKQQDGEISNFNISVGVTEAFMKAAREERDYQLLDPRTGEVVKTLPARAVFDLMVDMAWKNGEPGIVFLDRINRDNKTPKLGEIESTNPCGEQPLLPYESCNLASINLGLMIDEKSGAVDYERLERVTRMAVHFLDNVIDINRYPLPEIQQMTQATRKIGLGVMGWADMLFRLGVGYNSEEGVELAHKVMAHIDTVSKDESEKLAEVRGVFPAWEGSVWEKEGRRLRNATTTTIAPTGTISIIGNASSGVEPLFALAFVRNVMDNDALPEVHEGFAEYAKREGFYTADLMRTIAQKGTLHGIEGLEDVARVYVTAHDVTPEYHVRMQAAFQAHTDNAVSKTINFPNSATHSDVADAFWLAYDQGCKGITIYRDGSRYAQVLNIGEASAETADEVEAPSITPRARPEVTMGITEKVCIGCGNLYITVNYDDKGICEVFTNLGRAGGCPSQSEATSRLVSMALRSGMDVNILIEQLKGIRCHSTLRQKGLKVLSCPDAIGRVLEKVVAMQKAGTAMSAVSEPVAAPGQLPKIPLNGNGEDTSCPECGGVLEHESGCVVCRGCGYSKCG